jgi:hypothetical protein
MIYFLLNCNFTLNSIRSEIKPFLMNAIQITKLIRLRHSKEENMIDSDPKEPFLLMHCYAQGLHIKPGIGPEKKQFMLSPFAMFNNAK